MKTRSKLRTKLSKASAKRSGCLLLSKQTKHKQKQNTQVSTPKVPSQRRSTPLEPNFHATLIPKPLAQAVSLPPVCLSSMDTILRLLEGLRRDEIVWLNTYLTGRLRAMPPPPAAAAATAQVSAGPAHANWSGRKQTGAAGSKQNWSSGDFNLSKDPWEQTGAAGSVHDDLFLFLHAFTPLITFWFNL